MAEAKTLTLTEFLAARIDDDEDRARRAAFGWGESWSSNTDDGEDWSAVYAGVQYLFGHEDVDVMDYIARHDPARVLAECEAKRQAIDAAWMDHCRIENEWGTCMSRQEMEAVDDNPAVIECLALPYAEHPDYRQAWML